MTQEIRRRNEPLLVGGMYGQGTSHYLVTEHLEGFTLPHRPSAAAGRLGTGCGGRGLVRYAAGRGDTVGLQPARALCAADMRRTT